MYCLLHCTFTFTCIVKGTEYTVVCHSSLLTRAGTVPAQLQSVRAHLTPTHSRPLRLSVNLFRGPQTDQGTSREELQCSSVHFSLQWMYGIQHGYSLYGAVLMTGKTQHPLKLYTSLKLNHIIEKTLVNLVGQLQQF